jgi:protein gp37
MADKSAIEWTEATWLPSERMDGRDNRVCPEVCVFGVI